MSNTLPSTNRSLPIALIRARENIMTPIREMLMDSGLTEQQWRVLRVLAEFGPQDATEVSDRACLLLPSLTRIVRTLCEKKLITRQPDDSDRRRQTLEITLAGQQIIQSNHLQAVGIVQNLKLRLGEKNYEQLLDLLASLSASENNENARSDTNGFNENG